MLNVDLFFVAAITGSNEIQELVRGRIFDPARPESDEEEDKVPYIIVTYDAGGSSSSSDDDILAPLDNATVSVLCCANSRQELAVLTDSVQSVIGQELISRDLWQEHQEWSFYIDTATPSAGQVQLDPGKPCYYQTLTYVCETSTLQ